MSDPAELRGAHAPGGVAAARAALLAWIDAAGRSGRTFLQVRLLASGPGRYEIRNRRDVHRTLVSLSTVTSDPYAAREIAQVTNRGDHRPLKTSPNLRQGWALVDLDGAGVWNAMEYLYPAAATHWHAGRTGTLRVTHWSETAGRQSGIYSSVRLLDPPVVQSAVRACCDDEVCLRRVAWGVDEATPLAEASSETGVDGAEVPCPEACSMFISFARAVLVLERAPRREVRGLAPLNDAEIGQIRTLIAHAAAGTAAAAREGEFSEPMNSRRLRYLAGRLAASAREEPEAELPCDGCPRKIPCSGCPLI